ncbi:hypothetical protein ACFLZY_00625 [Patescibacteria group bacterium]
MPKLLTIGGVIDKSWDHYRAKFSELMSISSWILILAVFDIISLTLYPTVSKLTNEVALTSIEGFGVILFVFSNSILAPLFGLWLFTSLVRLIRSQISGRSIGAKKAMKEGLKYFIPAFYVSVLIVLILISGIILGFAPAFIVGFLATLAKSSGIVLITANLLLILGAFAALFLNFRWTVYYVLTPFAVLVENQRGISALTRTRQLVQGNFWHTLLMLIIPKAVFVVIGGIVLLFSTYLIRFFLTALGGINPDIQLRLLTIVSSVFPLIITAFLNPIIVIIDFMIYKNLMEVQGK